MKKAFIILLIVSIISSFVDARTWRDHSGRTIEAQVSKINSDRTVTLKLKNNNLKTVTFDIFSSNDIQYLEYLYSRRDRGPLHPVSWKKMNEIFGLNIWKDDWLWDDKTEEVGNRLKMNFESKTAFMENYRAYPAGDITILNEKVYATALYGDDCDAQNLSFIFINKGDVPNSSSEQIEDCANRLSDSLTSILGDSRRDSIGRGEMREKVWRWDWNDQALLLSLKKGKYIILKIMSCKQADNGGRIDKISYDNLRKRILNCVQRKDNGDILVTNIPMVDQGPKGYCSPATWERYLRYFSIPADMYLIAVAANTSAGGGTYNSTILRVMEPVLSSFGRDIISINSEMSIKNISRYIDQGLPIMWSFSSTPSFQKLADANSAKRKGEQLKEKDLDISPNEISRSSGHICLIIGYNESTQEICISDSWGLKYQERWVPVTVMKNTSYSPMHVLRW